MANVFLGDKAVGDIVTIKENGVAQNYIIVQKGKPSSLYDDSCDGVWLLREKSHSNRAWYGSNYNTSVNDYENSQIKDWLNSEFLNSIDSKIRAAIKTVKIPYKKGTGEDSSAVQSGTNGLNCKIFLLGGYEVGFTTSTNSNFPIDGARLAFFLNGNSDSSAKAKRICKDSGGNAVRWWLRSAVTANTGYAWNVPTGGTFNNDYTYHSYAVRPALILPFLLLVNDDGSVLTNTLPEITANKSGNLGTITDGLTITYSTNDADTVDTLTVKEYLDGTQKRSYTATKGKTETISYTGTEWQKVGNGAHTVKISCTDGKDTVEHNVQFTKNCTEATVTLSTPLDANDVITACSLKISGTLPNDTILKCEVTNNGKDSTPVWEDCTEKVKSEIPYIFKNKTAQNGFAFNFRISAKRGASGNGGYITGITGGFE